VELSYLPDAERHPLWPDLYRLLKPAADYGGIPVKDEDELVWIAYDGPTVFGAATTLLWDDGEAELRIAGGARFREWMGLLDEAVSAWARDCGAKKLTMRGRKGWVRYARTFGWVVLGTDHDGLTIFEKEL
jgi:hypothetical protein